MSGNNISLVDPSTYLILDASQEPINAGLIFDQPLVEGGGTSVKNYAQTKSYGALQGTCGWTNAQVGYAVTNANGALGSAVPGGAYIRTPELAYLQNGFTNYTVNVQYLEPSISSGVCILFSNAEGVDNYVNLALTIESSQLGIWTNNAFAYVNGPSPDDGKWHSLTATGNSVSNLLYLDKKVVLQFSSPVGGFSSMTPANGPYIGTACFNSLGAQGRTRVWNRMLTTNEINALYNQLYPP